ncbi:MAG TPA: PH domain-containing protein [Candidatus Woesebacteria bacterium]|nr:PH domain-containing protein [Candidatus Woesebacteria bacterium]
MPKNSQRSSSTNAASSDQSQKDQSELEVQTKMDQVSENEIFLSADQLSETIREEASKNNHVSAYIPKPKHTRFESQHKKEEIVLLLRRHPVTQLTKLIIIVSAALFPFVFWITGLLNYLPVAYQLAVGLSWYLLLTGFTLETFLTWYFRVFIITTKRVIDIDYYSMVHKDVSTAELRRIQDMSVVSTGVLPSMIDYGTLYVQTAGQNFNPARFNNQEEFDRSAGIEFEDIYQPIKVKRIVSELIESLRKRGLIPE